MARAIFSGVSGMGSGIDRLTGRPSFGFSFGFFPFIVPSLLLVRPSGPISLLEIIHESSEMRYNIPDGSYA